jgi:hypothetical protein
MANMLAPTGRTRVAVTAAALLGCLAALALPGPAQAKKRAKKATYVFLVTRVDLREGIPAKLEGLVRQRLAAAIDEHEQLEGELGDDAPDPAADPQAFERYLERKRIKAYKVNVEVTSYEREVEENDKKAGSILTVHLSLRLFGETVPQRVMAFTGDGSATIKLEAGKTLRSRDDQVAHEDAAELAVADAIATSIRKLEQAPKKKK